MKFFNNQASLAIVFATTVFTSACTGESAQNVLDGLVDVEVVDTQTVPEAVSQPGPDTAPPTPEAQPVTEAPPPPPPSEPDAPPITETPLVPESPSQPVQPEVQPVLDDTPVPQPPIDQVEILPTGIISSVAIGEIQGTFLAGAPPEPTGSIALEPLFVDGEPVQFISGGSTQVSLESNLPFITVFVVVDPEGYFKVELPEAQTTADLIITFSTIQLEGQLDEIAVSVASALGEISGAELLPVSSVTVGTGELQVSVSWNTPTDVDLYLTEPSGALIFFATGGSSSGGMLDLDSNAACNIDGVNNENITYENVIPPSGEYIVEVDYWSNCGVTTPTDFVVTVRSGAAVRTFPGTLEPADDNGIRNEIVRFQVQ